MKLTPILALTTSLASLSADSINLFPDQLDEWKMAGPGEFTVADKVATSTGGMGLWWFSGEKFKSATLSLEFKLDDANHNSGVFVRFPDPEGNPMAAVNQGYEVQISGREVNKNSTGAIYDIQAAVSNPLKEDGEWNTLRIHTITAPDSIVVELNGELVNIFNPQKGRGEKEGYFGIQNHDGNSKVQFRDISVTKNSSNFRLTDVVTPTQLGTYRFKRNPETAKSSKKSWYDLIDFGPAHVQTWADYYEGGYRPDSALKGILIRPDQSQPDLVVLFNSQTMQLVTATDQGVRLDNTPWAGNHASHNKVNNGEDPIFTQATEAAWPNAEGSYEDTREIAGHGNFSNLDFNGYFRHGRQIVLDYTVNGSPVLQTVSVNPDGEITSSYEGPEVDLTQLKSVEGLTTEVVTDTLSKLTKGGPAIFSETFEVTPRLGSGEEPFLVDQIPLPPVLEKSPWGVKVRVSDLDFFADGDRAAICTWDGDVWLLSGLNEFKTLTWKRFASGLFEPLGLKIVDDVIHVSSRDAIWQLIDLNSDDEADHYKIFNKDILITNNFHEFAFGLETDSEGNFYFSKAAPVRSGGRNFEEILPHNGAFLKLTADGKDLSVVATGLRAPGGIGVGPNGELTTGENEGTWQPACKINYFTKEERPVFLGVEQTRHGLEKDFDEPLCYLPMKVDNSGGQQVWVPSFAKMGLAEDELLHLSYGQSSIYRVLTQKLASGQMQGGVVKLPIQLSSSAQRAAFHKDGSMYVGGMRGWQSNATSEAGIQRVRYQEDVPLNLPEHLEVAGNQLVIRFDSQLDDELATDLESFAIKQWNYVRSPQYGSGHFSVDNPDQEAMDLAMVQESKAHRVEDVVEITKVTLDEDGRTLRLTIPTLKPAMQMEIDYDLETVDGDAIIGAIFSTIHGTE